MNFEISDSAFWKFVEILSSRPYRKNLILWEDKDYPNFVTFKQFFRGSALILCKNWEAFNNFSIIRIESFKFLN